MGMYILWIYGSKKEGIKMKKIISIIILLLSFSLSSCFEKKIDPTWYGSSYGYSQVIDGLEVCLRTDGYYQIVGVKEEAIKNGVLIIPQYINGIPVMGFGVYSYYKINDYDINTIDFRSLNWVINTKNYSIALEQDSQVYRKMSHCILDNPANELAYCTKNENSSLKKVIFSCHHMNFKIGEIFRVFPTMEIYIHNIDDIFVTDDINDYLNRPLYVVNSSERSDYMPIESYDDPEYIVRFAAHFYTQFAEIQTLFIYDSHTYCNRKKIIEDGILLIAKKCQEMTISRYNSLLELYGDEYDWNWYLEYFKNIEYYVYTSSRYNYPRYEGDSFESQDYYEYLCGLLNECYIINSNIASANVEFYYNDIDGEEYHSWLRSNDNIYMIDYLENGDILAEPSVPYVEGHTFLGWYTDPECTQLYDFTKPVSQIEDELVWLKLYAKWQ